MTDELKAIHHVFTPYITIATDPDGTNPRLIEVDWDDSHRQSVEVLDFDSGPTEGDQLSGRDPIVRSTTEWMDERTAAITAAITGAISGACAVCGSPVVAFGDGPKLCSENDDHRWEA